jgi:hydroxymethylglutaryl-CoA synthase
VGRGQTGGLPIKEKAVAGLDEDVITMSIEAARNALPARRIDPELLRAVWVGSESHPYAVKPSSTIVAEAVGASPAYPGRRLGVCLQGRHRSDGGRHGPGRLGMADYALAIGMDTAQGQPGDALEYTAGSGGAAYVIGPAEDALAEIEASYSFVTDTPDFWRRAEQKYPEHGQRFTGEPAYFKHITDGRAALMEEMGTTAADYTYAVFHQPNTKFPQRAAACWASRMSRSSLGCWCR